MEVNEQKAMLLESMIKFAENFGNENLGECEVDILKILNFADSEYFKLMLAWDCITQDDYFVLIEKMVLEGFAIWDFLKISDWTRKILDKEFAQEEIKREQEIQNKYICYKCQYFSQHETSLGIIYKCNKPRNNKSMRTIMTPRNRVFEPVEKCENVVFKI